MIQDPIELSTAPVWMVPPGYYAKPVQIEVAGVLITRPRGWVRLYNRWREWGESEEVAMIRADEQAAADKASGFRRPLSSLQLVEELRRRIRRLESELGAMELDNAELRMEIERLQAEREQSQPVAA